MARKMSVVLLRSPKVTQIGPKRMKLSSQLLVANLILLVIIWWCAFNPSTTNLVVALVACPSMFVLRFLSVRAARKEHNEAVARIRSKIAALRAKREAKGGS